MDASQVRILRGSNQAGNTPGQALVLACGNKRIKFGCLTGIGYLIFNIIFFGGVYELILFNI